MKSVIIQRGIPGSGKSTDTCRLVENALVSGLSTCVVSADHFFMNGETYFFDARRLDDAHSTCFKQFLHALTTGVDLIVVDNTNTRLKEFENYLLVARLAGYDVQVRSRLPKNEKEIEEWAARCVHDVPLNKVLQMHRRWEKFEAEILL